MSSASICPRCAAGLESKKYGGVEILACSSNGGCGGVWCSQAAFDAMETSTREAVRRAPEVKLAPVKPFPGIADGANLACPECEQAMHQRHFRYEARPMPIVLDHCDDHGIWFDADELDGALRIVENHAVARRKASELPKAKPELDRAITRARHARWLRGRSRDDERLMSGFDEGFAEVAFFTLLDSLFDGF